MVCYHYHTKVSFKEIVEWLIKGKFLGRSLFRAPETSAFTSRAARNVLNDAWINWQPFVNRRRFAFILDDTLFSCIFSTKNEPLALS